MSARKVEQDIAVRHPRETTACSVIARPSGVAECLPQRTYSACLADRRRAGHRQGDAGISHGAVRARASQPAGAGVQRAETLDVDPSDPVARHVAAGAHGGLLVLERSLNDKGVMRTVITVDETRETISFFGSTAAVDGWRVCIVDTVDELNPNAANALLKILEEPPQQSLFLLVSHAPARALPTILSRCRKLPLRPLSTDDVIRAAARAADIAADDPALTEAAEAAEGSVSRALTLLGGDALKLQQRTAALLATLPQVDPRELHALGDALGTSDRVALAAFIDGVERWIERTAARRRRQCQPSAPCTAGGGMGKDQSAPRAIPQDYNLERKPLVFSVFGLLAEATR